MAGAIVQLRAVYLSGDSVSYWRFHIAQDNNASIRLPGASF